MRDGGVSAPSRAANIGKPRKGKHGTVVVCGFLAIPVIEIALMIEIGGWMGVAPTVAAIILTAGIGTGLFRWQGPRVLHELRDALHAGEVPLAAVLDGAGLLLAGVLLFLPGFATDLLGFLLFIPPFRVLLLALLARRLAQRVMRRPVGPGGGGGMGGGGSGAPPPIIDGDFSEVENPPPRDRSEP